MPDPLYEAIQKALNEPINAALFERCAVDLLREHYPNLRPVPPNKDAGQDGLGETPDGTPFFLAQNYRRNQPSRTAGRRAVVLATSRSVSASLYAAPSSTRALSTKVEEGATLAHRQAWRRERATGASSQDRQARYYPRKAGVDGARPARCELLAAIYETFRRRQACASRFSTVHRGTGLRARNDYLPEEFHLRSIHAVGIARKWQLRPKVSLGLNVRGVSWESGVGAPLKAGVVRTHAEKTRHVPSSPDAQVEHLASSGPIP